MNEQIKQIKAEIERRIKSLHGWENISAQNELFSLSEWIKSNIK